MPDVRLVNVSKRFGPIQALTDINLRIEDREYISVIGPSGCGKTTLLRIIAGVIGPDSGEVWIDERPVNGVPPEDRGMAYVFQNLLLFPHMNVIDNVSYGPMIRNRGRRETSRVVSDILRLMDLHLRGEASPSELSRGMQQKIALARSLASGSSLLLLDEPLSTLDTRARYELRHELRDLVKDVGLTAIHVTHDQDEAMSVADRVVVMRKGSLVDSGSPIALYEHPSTPFLARFLGGECNFLEGVITSNKEDFTEIAVGDLLFQGPPSALEIGERTLIAIRPEHLTVDSGASIGIRASIENAQYLGVFTWYRLRTESGLEMIAKKFSGEQVFMCGDKVSVSMDGRAVNLFPVPREGVKEATSIE
ncbi:MAG: ABC transporter ATP-binding protein [Nitrososphaeria archaeon]